MNPFNSGEISIVNRSCRPTTGKASAEQIADWAKQIPDWKISQAELSKTFRFKDYCQTIGFVNAIAWIANAQDHHPDLIVKNQTCEVRFTTHSAGGLSENDFICAAKVDALIK